MSDNSILRAADRKNQYYSLLYSEMAERKHVEENLRRSNLLLQALSNAQLQYVAGADLTQVFSNLLQTLLNVTQAKQGLLCDDGDADVSHPAHRLQIIEGKYLNEDKVAYFASIAAQVIREGRILLARPTNLPHAQDTAQNIDATYCLGLPITITTMPHQSHNQVPATPDKNLVGAIVLSGHAEDLDPSLVELLQPLVVTCAQLIVAQRNDIRRRAAEVALVEERALLARRVAERTAELTCSNAELARASRAKDEFLATMNHELRTPLNTVLLYAESLAKQLPGPLNERQLRAASGIRESANHLLLLINDILDVAKIDAGKLNLDLKATSTENVCQSSLRLISELAQKKSLSLHFKHDPTVSQLDVDELRLKQMLVNLLGNAVKFTADGGEIGLEVTGDEVHNTVIFAVWDTGIGIAQDDIKKLFQPFAQLDSSHIRQHSGTGLGLFLVYRMAELHGGNVSVTSTVDKGSRFTISLPWHHSLQNHAPSEMPAHSPTQNEHNHRVNAPVEKRADAQPASAMVQSTVAPSTDSFQVSPNLEKPSTRATSAPIPTVLIADDNAANLQVISDFLQEWECHVIIARTGVEAVQRAKEWHPALILMDIQMPEMNGLDAIRLIRQDTKTKQTPIVAVTALAMPGNREQCLAAGADDYVSKPIQFDRLTRVMNTYLKHTLMGKTP